MFLEVNVTSGPLNGTNEPDGDFLNYGARKGLASWLGCVSVVGFCGNFIVVLAVILHPKLRTITNVFVTSLAISDMLVCLTIPWIIVGLLSTHGWPLPEAMCVLVAILHFTLSGSSVWHLVTIGFNRMILITTSKGNYKKVYNRLTVPLFLTLTWLIPFSVIIIPFVSGVTRLGYDNGPHLCSDLEEEEDGTENQIHAHLTATFLACFPLFIVIVIYLRIYVFVRLHSRRQFARWSTKPESAVKTVSSTVDDANCDVKGGGNFPGPSRNTESNGDEKQTSTANPTAATTQPRVNNKRPDLENRITKNTFYVSLGFILCMIPYGIFILIRVSPKGTPLAQAFILFNTCLNPLIYGTKHPHFRVAIRNMFRGQLSGSLTTGNTVIPFSQNT